MAKTVDIFFCSPGVLNSLRSSSGEAYVFDGFYPVSAAQEGARAQAASYLGGPELTSNEMTLELCADFCDKSSSAYFAVTDGAFSYPHQSSRQTDSSRRYLFMWEFRAIGDSKVQRGDDSALPREPRRNLRFTGIRYCV